MAAVTSNGIRESSLVFGEYITVSPGHALSNRPVSPSTVQTPPLNHADALNTPSKSFITHHENYSFTSDTNFSNDEDSNLCIGVTGLSAQQEPVRVLSS